MKDNIFNFNQVFLNTLNSETSCFDLGGVAQQLLSLSHLGNISVYISEKSLSILLAKASFALLLISMLSYWFQMSFKSEMLMKSTTSSASDLSMNEGQRFTKSVNFLKKVPLVTMWSANITLALLLSIRWIESGHFPLSNLYESLIFLSWSLTVIHLVLENFFHKKEQILCSTSKASTLTLGAITSPVTLFTNAFATFSLPQDMQKVTVLVPALKSNWLIMHVSVMIISYAALLSGSLLAMAFLVVKFIDDKKFPSIVYTFLNSLSLLTQFINRGFTFLSLLLSKKEDVKAFSKAQDTHAPQPVTQGKPLNVELRTKCLASDARHSKGVVVQSKHVLGTEYWACETARLSPALISTALEGYSFVTPTDCSREALEQNVSCKALQEAEEQRKAFTLLDGYAKQDATLQKAEGSEPLLLKNLQKENKVLMEIKNVQFLDLPQILDNLSYRSIGLGFALLTIGILSGAVWANEAWGSYWSWDPKETWAFITWLVFALYLHTRLSKGWVGKESAFVASFGFVVIWFCYLGVNLFGKGLHSYGWFQQ